jgi:ABC-type sugar transport system substrate-binding protein
LDSSSGSDLDSLLLAATASLGTGHNQGPPLQDPPEIPELKPPSSSDRTAFARSAANWIGAALGAGASIAAAGFIGLLNHVEWLQGYQSAIESYRDPPRTMEE